MHAFDILGTKLKVTLCRMCTADFICYTEKGNIKFNKVGFWPKMVRYVTNIMLVKKKPTA